MGPASGLEEPAVTMETAPAGRKHGSFAVLSALVPMRLRLSLTTRNAVYNLTAEMNHLLQHSIARGRLEILRRKRKRPAHNVKCLCPVVPCFAVI